MINPFSNCFGLNKTAWMLFPNRNLCFPESYKSPPRMRCLRDTTTRGNISWVCRLAILKFTSGCNEREGTREGHGFWIFGMRLTRRSIIMWWVLLPYSVCGSHFFILIQVRFATSSSSSLFWSKSKLMANLEKSQLHVL